MVKLKEIPRTATFAWSPVSQDPFLVTGTVAGAVDADFSSTTKLELWDLNLIDRSPDSFYLEPKVSIDTDARYAFYPEISCWLFIFHLIQFYFYTRQTY